MLIVSLFSSDRSFEQALERGVGSLGGNFIVIILVARPLYETSSQRIELSEARHFYTSQPNEFASRFKRGHHKKMLSSTPQNNSIFARHT